MNTVWTTSTKLTFLTALLIVVYLFRHILVAPPAVDPDHAFNTQRTFERLERILGDQRPHSVDTDANDEVIARLKSEISDLGFVPIVKDEFHCVSWQRSARCARLQNIMFWVTEPGPNAVLVLSHHDSVPAGPGASDDGAGVAASLEIASLMAERDLNRPLLVLITDGEELGLMGANMFVEKNPLAKMVGAVVNMEARGVSGVTAFFQTSRPNGRDLEALNSSTRLPAASSLNSDIYELLPNDTDLTEFLGLPIDAANFAYSGDVAFYHTPGDTLENMDKRALFHLGASGLAAVEAFMSQTGEEAERQLLYVDIFGLRVISMSAYICLTIILLTGVVTAGHLWSLRAATPLLKTICLPPFALSIGLAFAIGATALVSFIRPETGYSSAYPIVLRGLHVSAGLLGTLLAYLFLASRQTTKAMLMSAWLWTVIFSLTVFFLVQGATILFIPALMFFGLGAFILFYRTETKPIVLPLLGFLAFAAIALPLSALGETSLIIENAAPFVFALILLFLYVAPIHIGEEQAQGTTFKTPAILASAVALVFGLFSLFVPAYSEHSPRALSITHIQSANFENAQWSVFGSDPVPESMQAVADFSQGSLPVFGGPRQLAQAPHLTSNMKASFTRDTQSEDTRSTILEVEGAKIDRLSVSLDTGNPLSHLKINGFEIETPDSILNIICSGRTCRSAKIEFGFAPSETPLLVDVVASRFGLGPAGQTLIDARPDWAISRQNGDSRITHIRISPDTPS